MTATRPRTRRCLLCDSPADYREHHPTGKRWDPDVLVPLCHDHHMAVHDDWDRAGVGPKVQPPTWLHAQVVTMRRWAMLLGHCVDLGKLPDLTGPLADWFSVNAQRLDIAVTALDSLGEVWRALTGIVVPPRRFETD